MMHDSGDRTEALMKMWSRVKGDNANMWTYVLVGGVVVILCALVATRLTSGKRKKHGRRR